MLNEDLLEYEVEIDSQLTYTYLTMAIYQNSYGMTDKRKPEFKLTVSSEEITEVSGPLLLQRSPTTEASYEKEVEAE